MGGMEWNDRKLDTISCRRGIKFGRTLPGGTSRVRLTCLLLSVICLFFPCLVQADLNQWVPFGPDGGTVYSIAVDPVNTAIMYAGTNGGVYKSANGGGSWTKVNNGISNGQTRIFGLAVDPSNHNVVWAAGDTVYMSTDGGGTWSGVANCIYEHSLNAVAIDPVDSSSVYLGGGDGIYKRPTQQGGCWTKVYTMEVNTVVIDPDPAFHNTVYAAGNDGKILKSTDGGANWGNLTINFPAVSDPWTNKIVSILIDPTVHTTLYVATSNGLYKSTDGGGSFASAGLTGFVSTIARDAGGNLYATQIQTDNTALTFKSPDGGTTWNVLNNGPHAHAGCLISVPGGPMYAGLTGHGILKTSDEGQNWYPANTGIYAQCIDSVAVSPANPNVAYVSAENFGVSKTTDGGTSWTRVNSDLWHVDSWGGTNTTYIGAVGIDPSNPSNVYAGTVPDGFFRSTNGGASWEYANTGLPTNCWYRGIAVDPKHPNIVFALVGYGGVYKSIDYGQTWNASYWDMSTATDVYGIAIDPVNTDIVYVGTKDAGIIKTINGGTDWVQLPNITAMVNGLAIDPRNTQTVFAAGIRSNVFKSTDGGQTWDWVTPAYGINAIFINPAAPWEIYAGTETGVAKSTHWGNRGTWTFIDYGFQDRKVYALAMDATGRNLFRTTNGSSVYRLDINPSSPPDSSSIFMLLLSD